MGKYCERRLESPCKRDPSRCNQLKSQGTCQDAATEAEPDAYECTCEPLFNGRNCENRVDSSVGLVSACTSNHNCVLNDKLAECIDLKNNSYICKCSSGFMGKSCNLENRCPNSPCKNNGTCIQKEDSFRCDCGSFYLLFIHFVIRLIIIKFKERK